MTGVPSLERPRGLDPARAGALGALLLLRLGYIFKPGIDAASGARVRPVPQLLFSFGILGLMFSANTSRTGLQEFLELLFLGAAGLVALSVLPETPEVREMHGDVLGCRPVSAGRAVFSTALTLAVAAGFVASCFVVPGLVVSAVRHGVGVGRAVLLWVALLLFCAALAFTWVRVLVVLMRFVATETVRKTAQYALVLAITACAGLSAGIIDPRLAAPPWFADALALSPTSFVARIGAPGSSLLQDAGRLLVLALAAAALARFSISAQDRERWVDATARPGAAVPPSLRAARFLAAWRLAGRKTAAASGAVTEAVLAAWSREELGRVRVLSSNAMALMFFGAGALGVELLPLTGLSYLGFAGVIEGLQMARQSSSAEAGWIFRAAPLPGRAVVDGVYRAIALRLLPLPALLLSVLAVREGGLLVGPAAALMFLAALRLAGMLVAAVSPGYPLSTAARAMPPVLGFVFAFLLTAGGAVLQGVVLGLVMVLGGLGTALALVLAGGVWGLSMLARMWAGSRLDALARQELGPTP